MVCTLRAVGVITEAIPRGSARPNPTS
ncbi:hypothetical protein A2U01_0099513, partial [Trifolium medium]|nr:hypothetical protein [Trifolium medium]